MSKCQHLITDENDECYPCKITALFRMVGEREAELNAEKERSALLAGAFREILIVSDCDASYAIAEKALTPPVPAEKCKKLSDGDSTGQKDGA